MKDSDTNIAQLKAMVKKHCDERNWDQYHNPKELAVGLIIEAAELLEQFRFKPEAEMEAMLKDPKKKLAMNEEMADILYYLLRLSQKYDIDLAAAFEKKMEQNRKKYPVDKSFGSNKKYDEL